MAYKPFLNKAPSAMDKSDPAQDSDGDDDFADRKEKGSLSESDAFFFDENPTVA
ncbi:outer envelope membrane protein 7 [Populus alba x Populus x berolinensis]|nr:outer envelope membrane protein 7 [Populus alba x Populus x berolinensis]